jgi:hypothetical protein
MTVSGDYGIPLVAFDRTAGGLSGDGRTLVLGEAAVGGPPLRPNSSFAVVDLRRFSVQATVRLHGDFVFDALSPGGQMLYLIEHVSSQDPTKYQVRAYDLGAQRLLPQVVVDKRSWEGVMQGVPLTRVSTANGRWDYTLYGGGSHPFIHALDTQRVNAVCIDLPRSWQQFDVNGLRLHLTGDGRLLVRHRLGGKPLAIVDTTSFRILKVVRNP